MSFSNWIWESISWNHCFQIPPGTDGPHSFAEADGQFVGAPRVRAPDFALQTPPPKFARMTTASTLVNPGNSKEAEPAPSVVNPGAKDPPKNLVPVKRERGVADETNQQPQPKSAAYDKYYHRPVFEKHVIFIQQEFIQNVNSEGYQKNWD